MESRWSLIFAVGILVAGAFAQSSERQCDPFVHDADPSDCSKFTNCYGGFDHQFSCPGDLFFDTETQRCESRQLPGCNEDGTPTTVDPCSQNPCRQPQFCHVTNNNAQRYECRCSVGWQGPSCDRDVDECVNRPCNNGSCVNTAGSFFCNCAGSGKHGMRCERLGEAESYDACTPRPCGANGWCSVDSLSPNGYKCNCNNGFSGEHCTQATGQASTPGPISGACARNPCGSNGRCVSSNLNAQGYTCQCNSGFQGQTCAQDIDECRGTFNQCNNGQCQNTFGSFQCNCFAGWSGDRCDQREAASNACASNPCGSNGRCSPSTVNAQGYTCQCNTGFQGQNCSQDIDECRGVFNQCNNGQCQNTFGSFQCNCFVGWTGDRCDQRTGGTNACASRPCGNNGQCTVNASNFNGYTCQCNAGFSGQTCSQDVNECLAGRPCNNGQCINNFGSFQCRCYIGWTGPTCTTRSN